MGNLWYFDAYFWGYKAILKMRYFHIFMWVIIQIAASHLGGLRFFFKLPYIYQSVKELCMLIRNKHTIRAEVAWGKRGQTYQNVPGF